MAERFQLFDRVEPTVIDDNQVSPELFTSVVEDLQPSSPIARRHPDVYGIYYEQFIGRTARGVYLNQPTGFPPSVTPGQIRSVLTTLRQVADSEEKPIIPFESIIDSEKEHFFMRPSLATLYSYDTELRNEDEIILRSPASRYSEAIRKKVFIQKTGRGYTFPMSLGLDSVGFLLKKDADKLFNSNLAPDIVSGQKYTINKV